MDVFRQSQGNPFELELEGKPNPVLAQVPVFAGDAVQRQEFSPYADNGGSVVAVGGDGYVIVASDTRLSSGFSIYTRDQSKLFRLTDTTILGSSGCWCDILSFTRMVEARIKMYRYQHNRDPTTQATAQMISNLLYFKRFFPYYISNIVVGLDENGKGAVYSYDPVGHMEKHPYRASGSSAALLQPLLDSIVGLKNMEEINENWRNLSEEDAIKLVKDVFTSAAERDIYCGDAAVIQVITREGIQELTHQLRKD